MSKARNMRRHLKRTTGPTPIGTEPLGYEPDKIVLSIRYDEATLNWHATAKDLEKAYLSLSDKPIEREIGAQQFKEEMRNVIILGIERNDHLKLREANLMATVAMWYIWLKRDAILNPPNAPAFSWDKIAHLTMVITRGENRWYQFSWEIKFKEQLELPDLERINVWTPFRIDGKFEPRA